MAKLVEHPLPARIMHYVHLLSMVVLIFTGFFIHFPFLAAPMGIMRLVHFIAMYVLVINLVARAYWAFFGTPHDYREFFWSRQNRGTFWQIIKYYLFLQKKHPVTGKYNTLQKITYVFWALLILVQAYTGFSLYWPTVPIFASFVTLAGGLFYVRMIHFLVMWVFIATAGLHLYLVLAEDIVQLPYMFFGIKPRQSKH